MSCTPVTEPTHLGNKTFVLTMHSALVIRIGTSIQQVSYFYNKSRATSNGFLRPYFLEKCGELWISGLSRTNFPFFPAVASQSNEITT
jgi:hypothetical protein